MGLFEDLFDYSSIDVNIISKVIFWSRTLKTGFMIRGIAKFFSRATSGY